MPYVDQAELDALRARCAELELDADQRGDPLTSLDIARAPGRNALFCAIQMARMPMVLTDPHRPDNPIIFANRSFIEMSGYSEAEIVGRNCRFLQGEDTSPGDVDRIRQAIATRSRIAIDIVNYRKDGKRFVNELYISPVFDAEGGLLYFFGSQVNITTYLETRLFTQLALIERERHVLGQIAAGVPLPQVLDDLLHTVEAEYGHGVRTSILFLSGDGRHLEHGAAPSLPPAFNDAIHGIPIGRGIGSCGAAASQGTPVCVSDIAADPLWTDYRDLALAHDLRACWSTPIKAADGSVLGIFAMYYDTPRSPVQEEIATIAFITQAAALAIEQHRHEIDLRRSEERLSASNVALQAANGSLRALTAGLEDAVAERTEELEAARYSLETALSAADMGGWDVDLTTGDARRTLRHDQIFGHDAPLETWDHAIFLSYVQPSHRAMVEAAFESARLGETLDFECPIRTADGKDRWISAKGHTAYGPDGEPVRMAGVVFDITARKETEAQLAQAQKMEAVGQLTGGVAHDFNNLLTVIRGSVDLLRRPAINEERRTRYIDAIGETADRAAKLTAQLLAFARRQALAPEAFDCGKSIEDVSAIVRTLTGARIHLTAIVPDDPCFVVADRGQFDTAIINMSVNARDAMNGQGDLTIAVGPVSGIPAIRGHAPVVGEFVAVTIKDTGSGITPDSAARIFEPFYTTKGPGHGTGLGLSQVFGFAKQSNGDVRMDSVVGQGTTFTLYLPRALGPDGSGETGSAPPLRTNGDGMSVLVVEDNERVGEFAVQALRELGYRTVLASDAAAALARLASERDRFDIVFSDVVMPGMDGLEMGREIRRLYPNLPVILTSGYSHVLARNGQHGFELLHKPYSIEQLSAILQKAIVWQSRQVRG